MKKSHIAWPGVWSRSFGLRPQGKLFAWAKYEKTTTTTMQYSNGQEDSL
jgi:hypothetical protein